MWSKFSRRQGSIMEPAIPQSWDGKIVLAAMFVICYFSLAAWLIKFGGLSNNQKELALVVLAATSPQLTQIFTALFRTTAADERQAALRSADLQTAITAAPVANGLEDAGERGIHRAEPITTDRPAPSSPASEDDLHE